jgi:hypothetical protein
MSWKLWGWQRFQQFTGALLVLVLAGAFLVYLATGQLPGEDFRQDIPIEKYDTRVLDHLHIAVAIGSCHSPVSPVIWPGHWLQTLRLDRSMVQQLANAGAIDRPGISAARSLSADAFPVAPTDDLAQEALTSYERAAIYHSDRIQRERAQYLEEAERRQNRIRRNQLRILLLSAAGAFLVGMTTLMAGKDADAPFKSLSRGALLPISALALLMPLLSTAMSGVVAFDDDAKIALRDQRTLAQLEQLHGRVAEDVTSDPYRCPIMRAAQDLERAQAGTVLPANALGLSRCIMDRMQRTVAWEQRHEQILNDASQTLARAGDLARPGDANRPAPRDPTPGQVAAHDAALGQVPTRHVAPEHVATTALGDPCQEMFDGSGRATAGETNDATQPKRG